MSKDYAPLPFSYLTGGVAPEKKPTGFKKSVSDNEAAPAGEDSSAPYSIYSGRTLEQAGSNETSRKLDVVSMDVADPYLLSTGALTSNPEAGVREPKNSYANDPRYRDSVPSESDGGNVFFRSPDGDDGPLSPQQHQQQQMAPVSRDPERTAPASRDHVYSNQGFDDPTPGGANKLPRFMVSDQGIYQYYSGTNGDVADGRRTNDTRPNGADNSANPIWDKYYATGGVDPELQVKKPTGGLPVAGARPMTKADDLNTILRSNSSPGTDDEPSCCCCQTKKSAVLCAIFLTALICLAIGFACGWIVYQQFMGTTGGAVGTTTSTSTPVLSTTTSTTKQMTEMLTAITANSTDSPVTNTTST